MPDCLGRPLPFSTYWMPFRSGERGFYANAAIGDDVSPERVAELQAVLDSLVFRETHVEDDRQRGVRFSYAQPWRVYPFALTEAVQLRHQIALGTFALDQAQPDHNCAPASALSARGEDGGLLYVFEYADLERRGAAAHARLRAGGDRAAARSAAGNRQLAHPPRPRRAGRPARAGRPCDAVADWVRDLVRAERPTAGRAPALTALPSPGRLLVAGPGGVWVVQSCGGARRLGAYEDATWSPRGLFAGATRGRSLSAVEPDGTVRWTLARRRRPSPRGRRHRPPVRPPPCEAAGECRRSAAGHGRQGARRPG